jgi:hypothetical protein
MPRITPIRAGANVTMGSNLAHVAQDRRLLRRFMTARMLLPAKPVRISAIFPLALLLLSAACGAGASAASDASDGGTTNDGRGACSTSCDAPQGKDICACASGFGDPPLYGSPFCQGTESSLMVQQCRYDETTRCGCRPGYFDQHAFIACWTVGQPSPTGGIIENDEAGAAHRVGSPDEDHHFCCGACDGTLQTMSRDVEAEDGRLQE